MMSSPRWRTWPTCCAPTPGSVRCTARDGAAALRVLRAIADGIDAVFLDIRMRGLDGVVLGRLLSQFANPPRVVFVTAYEEHAVDAFEIKAEDYLLKPVRPERLAEAIRRVASRGVRRATPWAAPTTDTIPVELGGVTRFVASAEVRYVEAQGDYARLHTAERQPPGAHLAGHAGGALGRGRVRPGAPQPPGRGQAHRRAAHRLGPLRGPHRRRPRSRSAAGTPGSCATCCVRAARAVDGRSERRSRADRPRGRRVAPPTHAARVASDQPPDRRRPPPPLPGDP